MADDNKKSSADKGVASQVGNWLARPFREEMSVLNWALFTILIVTIAAAWIMILRNLTEGLEA